MRNLILVGLALSLFGTYATGLSVHPTKLDSTRNNTLTSNQPKQIEYTQTKMRQNVTKTYTLNNISKAQKELKLQGYYTGDIDGIVGGTTRSAIKRFQAHNTLDINGELSVDTLKALNISIDNDSLYSE